AGVSGPGANEARAGRDRAAAPRSCQAQGRTRHPKKSRRLLREGPDVMFSFVAKHRGMWPVAFLCEALGVSRSGFYAWLTRGPSARSRRDEVLSAKIRTSFADSDRTYGARRVWHDLLAAGVECGLHAIERQGWLYVAAVLDLFSRRVVGWSMSAAMTTELVTDALVMAIWRRGRPRELLHHSDRGSQYTSEAFQRLMAEHGVTCSLSRSGNVWDNAAMESFFSSLKVERVARKIYRTRDQARADVFDYIERFYNPRRRHSTIGYLSPMEFETKAGLA